MAAAREEIVRGLQTLNGNALALARLWGEAGYGAARLVDGGSEDLRARLPLQVCELVLRAGAHATGGKAAF